MSLKLPAEHLQLAAGQDGTTVLELKLISVLDQKTLFLLKLLQLFLLSPVFLHLPNMHKTHTGVIHTSSYAPH